MGRRVIGEDETGRPLTDLSVKRELRGDEAKARLLASRTNALVPKKRNVLSVGVRAGLDHTTYMKSGRTCERQAGSACVS